MEEKKIESKVEKAISEEKLYNQVYAQIMQERPFAKELSEYSEDEQNDFYESLVNEKLRYMQHGAMYYTMKQNAESEWVSHAMEGLKEIQLKKLFDLRCLWDAEKIAVPEIEASIDFYYHEQNVFNSPLLDPISQTEFDIYLSYVNSNNYQETYSLRFMDFDYEEIREAAKSDDPDYLIPEWYDFHNGRTGLGVYLLLPMIRTEKEDFYRALDAKENRNKREQEQQQAEEASFSQIKTPEIKPLPSINKHDNEQLDFIVSSFEDKETQNMYRKYKKMYQAIADREYDYFEIKQTLAQHCEVWPIEAHYDWREAFYNCYESYRKHKIAEALPLAYEEYKMYIEMKIPFKSNYDKAFSDNVINVVKSQILKGRALNNEPENFDF